MRYSKCKEIDNLAHELVAAGWQFKWGSKHGRLYHPSGTGHLTVPTTPSSSRSYKNFRCDVKRLERTIGEGR